MYSPKIFIECYSNFLSLKNLEFMQEFNILYWGPEGAGKSTSLLFLSTSCTQKGKQSTKTIAETSVEHVFLEVPRTPQGPIQLVIETVSGSAQAKKARQTLLHKADGVLFVFDCTLSQEANFQSFSELRTQLQQKQVFETFPIVYQFNKQDASEKANFAEWLEAFPTNPYSISVATQGSGVYPAFHHLIKLLFLQKKLQKKLQLT